MSVRVVATISTGGAPVQISVIADTEDAGLLRLQNEAPTGWRINAHFVTVTDGVSTPSTQALDGARLIT